MTTKEMMRRLKEQYGWNLEDIKNSYHIFIHPVKRGKIIVPDDKGGTVHLPPGIWREILEKAR